MPAKAAPAKAPRCANCDRPRVEHSLMKAICPVVNSVQMRYREPKREHAVDILREIQQERLLCCEVCNAVKPLSLGVWTDPHRHLIAVEAFRAKHRECQAALDKMHQG